MSNTYDRLGFTKEDAEAANISLTSGEEQAYIKSEQLSAEEETTQEINASALELHEAAKNSLDFLAAMAMPLVFKFNYPEVFLAVWDWLTLYVHKTRDFSQLCLGLPRGFGKSTLMKVFILYCILFTKRKFILILGSTSAKATAILADVIDMLEEQNIKTVFGDWKIGIETNTQELKKFGFRGRNIILMASGAEGNIRGANLKNERPDVILFDDIQSIENAFSDTAAVALERWMYATALKTKSPSGCLYIYVGNMYASKNCILKKLKTNPMWIKFIAGGIKSDGSSLWEELQPIKQLLAEYENDLAAGHPEIFFSEVLNDENATANNLIDLSKLPSYPFEEDNIPGGNFIIIDPSNDKVHSDYTSIGYFEIHEGTPVLMELEEGRMSPGGMIDVALKLALRKQCRLIAVESNAYQYSALYWFDHTCLQYGIVGIQCVELYSGVYSKNSRIIKMFQSYLKGEIYVHAKCKAAVHTQIVGFNPIKTNNTDGILDLLTYAPKCIELYSEFIQSTGIIEAQLTDSIKVLEYNSPF